MAWVAARCPRRQAANWCPTCTLRWTAAASMRRQSATHCSAPTAKLVRASPTLLEPARARGSKDDATVLVVRREPRQTRLAGLAAAGMLLAALILTLMVVLP